MSRRAFATLLISAAGAWSCGAPRGGEALTQDRLSSEEASEISHRAADLIDEDPEEARALLEDVLKSDPFHGPSLNNLGILQLGSGDLEAAANSFESAGEVMPGQPDPRLNLGLTFERAGLYDAALKSYGTAIEILPGHLPSLCALTSLQIRLQRTDERTCTHLQMISLRSNDTAWGSWAQEQLSLLNQER